MFDLRFFDSLGFLIRVIFLNTNLERLDLLGMQIVKLSVQRWEKVCKVAAAFFDLLLRLDFEKVEVVPWKRHIDQLVDQVTCGLSQVLSLLAQLDLLHK